MYVGAMRGCSCADEVWGGWEGCGEDSVDVLYICIFLYVICTIRKK